MKKLLILITTGCLVSVTVIGQPAASPTEAAKREMINDLLQKSWSHNRTGTYLVAGGGLMLVSGVIWGVSESAKVLTGYSEGKDVTTGPAILIVGGLACIVTSVPFYVAGGRNKREAKLLLNTTSLSLAPGIISESRQLNMGIAINF